MTADTISLLLGHPDPTTLLTPELQAAVESLMSANAYRILQYGPEQGTQGLIAYLVDKLNREQGMAIAPGNVMIVAGSTHACDMIGRLYTKPGGVVIVEAPSYADSIHIFRDHHVELCSVPMDQDGMIVTELERLLARLDSESKKPDLLYTIPTFHNPTGITLSHERRLAIIQLAQRYGFLIVEDDVYRDLAFESGVPANFYALAHGQGVLSINSFSKTLAPGLRLGWLVGSESDIQRFVDCGTTQMGGGANPFTANIVAEYCRNGHWEPHVAGLQTLYKQRRDVVIEALSKYMPQGVRWTHPAGGFFIWLYLPDNVFAQDVKRLAHERKVLVAAGNGFYINPADGNHNLRLAFSFARPDDIEAGVHILGQVIRELQAGG
jgi:2-aminoadipate transaminase